MAKIDPNNLVDIDESNLVDLPANYGNVTANKFNPRTHPLHRLGSTAMKGGLGLAQLAAHMLPGDVGSSIDSYIANEDKLNAEANKGAYKLPILGVGVPEAAGYIADPLNMLMATKIAKPIMMSQAVNPVTKALETRALNKYMKKLATGKMPDTLDNFVGMPTVSNAPYSKLAKSIAAGATMGHLNGLIAPTVYNDYGTREDGTSKGSGYFGELPMTDGSNNVATELSIGVNIDGKETLIPALVPGLSESQKAHLLNGGKPTPDIVDVAVKHAKQRIAGGQSPFSENNILHERMNAANLGTAVGIALPAAAGTVGKVTDTIGDALASITGGGVGIKESYLAGLKGGDAQKAYKEYSKPDSSLTNVVPQIKEIVPVLSNEKNAAYNDAMQEFIDHNQYKVIDKVVPKVMTKLTKLDTETSYFGRDISPHVTAAKGQLRDLVEDWYSRDPQRFHTAPGLDHLKKEINALSDSIPNNLPGAKQSKAVYSQMADYVSKLINEEDPSYAMFMKPYAQSVQRIKEVEDSLLSDNTEVGVRKLSKALSSPFKRELLKEFEDRSMGELPSILAGYNTKNILPGSVYNTGVTTLGTVALSGILSGHPASALVLAGISPRLASGVANKIGSTKRLTAPAKDKLTSPSLINLMRQPVDNK